MIAGALATMVAVFAVPLPTAGQGTDTGAKLAQYKKGRSTFTTKSGKTYETGGIQRVTADTVSLITDDGIISIKPAEMPDDFRRMFGLTDEKLKEAQAEFARKRYDKQKAAVREKNAERLVSARKQRLQVTLAEEVEFGFVCDAMLVEEVVTTVEKAVRASALDRDQTVKKRRVAVKETKAVGLPEKMLLRGLPKSLKSGSQWEGDTYIVGTYVYEPRLNARGGEGPPPVDIPIAFVDYKEAVAYRASTPADGSEGSTFGTGVSIGKDGFILTSFRLVVDAERIQVVIPGRNQPLKATVVAMDAKENLAVLKVASLLQPVPIAASPRLTLGQEVFTVGYPDIDMRNRQVQLLEARVAALKGVQEDSRFFQAEGEFQAGHFGGGIFDARGFVIGIITPNPPESFFLEEGATEFEPLQYVTKGTRFENLLRDVTGFQPETAAPADPLEAARAAAILVEVKR